MKDELELQLGGATRGRSRHIDAHKRAPRPVLGIEAEFTLFIDDVQRRPEDVFGTARSLIREKMIPRTGRSYQLPSGGAIYFDTGVIEVATPIIELGPGCCYRATRLLWEQIRYVRQELDAWAEANGCKARLQGFSTHYNFSFPASRASAARTSAKLSYLLAHILPAPVALLAGNRQSSAIGVRPARLTAGGDRRLHARCRVDAGDVRVHRRRGRGDAALARLSARAHRGARHPAARAASACRNIRRVAVGAPLVRRCSTTHSRPIRTPQSGSCATAAS
jgi:hypothetical protein